MDVLVKPGSLPGTIGSPLQILNFSRSLAPIVGARQFNPLL